MDSRFTDVDGRFDGVDRRFDEMRTSGDPSFIASNK